MSGVRWEVCILLLIVVGLVASYTVCGCTRGGVKGVFEGLTNAVDWAQTVASEYPNADTQLSPYNELSNQSSSSMISSASPIAMISSSSSLSSKDPKAAVGVWGVISSWFGMDGNEGFDNLRQSAFGDISSFAPSAASPAQLATEDFFRGVSFSGKCCPSEYSTDKGCACLSPEKYEYIRSRGGNNVPISDM